MLDFLLTYLQKFNLVSPDLILSKLYDENSFYRKFINDLKHCKSEVIIESPFITSSRMRSLMPVFKNLVDRRVKVYVFTRDPKDQGNSLEIQSEQEVTNFESMGIQVLLCLGNHHRKLAILDRKILWEGSLNILSQTKSREIMRRIESSKQAREMFRFLKFEKYIY